MAKKNKKRATIDADQPAEHVDVGQDDRKTLDDTVKAKQYNLQFILRFVRTPILQLWDRYWLWRWWSIPATVVVLLLADLVFPLGGRSLAGLVLTRDVQFMVVDAATGRPVTNATFQDGGEIATSSVSGAAHLRVPIGMTDITVTKQYYKDASLTTFVSFGSSYGSAIRLTAIGRQVPVKVTNKISGKPVVGVTVTVLHSQAVTDKNGEAVIVLPAGVSTPKGTITGKGFNRLDITIQVTDQVVAANTFTVTPAGNIYFLSNLSGKIDVVKTNLDGTDRKTVLAGTGFEVPYATALLASRDWKYLALYAQRKANSNPEIDLIDTSNDAVSTIDEGDASFTLVGWAGDRFIYLVNRNTLHAWQSGHLVIKSFDATTQKLTALVQTTAAGSQFDYAAQTIDNAYILDGKVVYALGWVVSGSNQFQLSVKQPTLNVINPDGTNGTLIKAFSPLTNGGCCFLSLQTTPYDEPNSLAVQSLVGDQWTFYEYRGGKVSLAPNITQQNFYSRNYSTYVLSPSGSRLFWSIYADGKNNLTIGDQDRRNTQTIAAESDFSPYGWYTDDYLLVQKSGSELYIVSVDDASHPFKISNYYKPQNSYYGYGGGYGGL